MANNSPERSGGNTRVNFPTLSPTKQTKEKFETHQVCLLLTYNFPDFPDFFPSSSKTALQYRGLAHLPEKEHRDYSHQIRLETLVSQIGFSLWGPPQKSGNIKKLFSNHVFLLKNREYENLLKKLNQGPQPQ